MNALDKIKYYLTPQVAGHPQNKALSRVGHLAYEAQTLIAEAEVMQEFDDSVWLKVSRDSYEMLAAAVRDFNNVG